MLRPDDLVPENIHIAKFIANSGEQGVRAIFCVSWHLL